jgi:prevent-host-death family protein
MSMTTVNVHAAKSQLSRLLDAAAAGEEVIIAKAGKPIAKLVAIEQKKERRKLGTLAGQFRVPDDFDDPLPDEIVDSFEGR